MTILGIDVGGTGIKGAPVDTKTGKLLADRFRIQTPQPPKMQPIGEAVKQIVQHFDWKGPVGIGFPAPLRDNVVLTAAHVSSKFIGVDVAEFFKKETGLACTVLNDADAAGLAEMTLGAGRGHMGRALLIDLGTGIGTAFFYHGKLVPNLQLGHIEMNGKDAATRASGAAKETFNLSWKKYAKRVDRYLNAVQLLTWPELYIIGGGISKYHEKFLPLLTVDVPVVPAQFLNNAGIVGAALAVETKI